MFLTAERDSAGEDDLCLFRESTSDFVSRRTSGHYYPLCHCEMQASYQAGQ